MQDKKTKWKEEENKKINERVIKAKGNVISAEKKKTGLLGFKKTGCKMCGKKA